MWHVIVFLIYLHLLRIELVGFCRGVSSTVRRCSDRFTKVEYAVKIIDLVSADNQGYQSDSVLQSTRKEVNILRMCSEHDHISTSLQCYITTIRLNHTQSTYPHAMCKMRKSAVTSSWFCCFVLQLTFTTCTRGRPLCSSCLKCKY